MTDKQIEKERSMISNTYSTPDAPEASECDDD